MKHTLLSAVADGEGTNSVPMQNDLGSGTMLVQVSFLGTAAGSVALYGRITDEHDWVLLKGSITADMLEYMSAVPYMRAVLTGGSGLGGANKVLAEVLDQ